MLFQHQRSTGRQQMALSLPREPATVEKRQFGRRRVAAEHAVSMRKSAELRDDVAVPRRVFRQSGVAECRVQRNATILIGNESQCMKGR